MDWQTRFGLAIVVTLASSGCSGSAPPDAASAPAEQATAAAPPPTELVETHHFQASGGAARAVPTVEITAQPSSPAEPASPAPHQALSSVAPPTSVAPPPPLWFDPPPPTPPPPPATDADANPLRSRFAPASRAAEPRILAQPADETNPLRGMPAAQRPPPPPSDSVAGGDHATPPAGGAAPQSIAPASPTRAGSAAAPPTAGFWSGLAAGSPPASSPDDAPQTKSYAVEVSDEAMQPGAPAPQEPADSTSRQRVVQVFYATDRQAIEPGASGWSNAISRLIAAGFSLLVTLSLGLAATVRKSFALWLSMVAGLGITLGLSYQGAAMALAAVRDAAKEGPRYSTARATGGRVDLGICEVTIPPDHAPGELESPSIWRLEIADDPGRFVSLRKTERLADQRFYDLLRERVAASPRRELFVFVHGFNVSFADAARRTAQIHFDLKFEGAPIFFSWPAHDKFLVTYPADENNIVWSTPHLKQFLLDVVKHSGAQSINLIAHSMGNRALATALREIDLELRDQGRLFNQVVLAAPDIDADDFRNNIAPAMQRTARRLTLYASSRDDALLASQFLHRGPRAGDAGKGLVVIPGIDTIDVTAIDTSPWGHTYYGSSDPVLRDLQLLFSRAIPPDQRSWLLPAARDGLTYWIFQPARTAGGETPLAR